MDKWKDAIQVMPKVELHLHLDGSVKPGTLIALAKQQNKTLPTKDEHEIIGWMQVEETCENLNQYLSTFDFVLPFLQNAEALEQVAFELVEQVAEQHVRYVEVRFAPQLHVFEGLSVESAYQAVINGLNRGEQAFGVIARCIGICLRGHTEEQNLETIEKAKPFLDHGLVAVDLAGAEALYPPELYKSIFTRAQQLGLPITIHAGEAGGAVNIKTSIEELGASRIGHGVRLREDQALFKEIIAKKIPLEFCPISNIQTKAVSGWDAYPILEYMEAGIKVTVNTDNLTVSNTNLTKELLTLKHYFNLNIQQMLQLQNNAASSVFLESKLKPAFIASFSEQLTQWQKQHQLE